MHTFKANRFISETEMKAAAKAVKMFSSEKWEAITKKIFISETRKNVSK